MGIRIIIILLLLFISIGVWANRISMPPKITDLNDKNQLVKLNDFLQEVWNITNGRYSPDSSSTVSSGTGTVKMANSSNANSAGFISIILTNGTTVYLPYWTDTTP